MNIEVKGHSGCQIEVRNEEETLFVYKRSTSPDYLHRLYLQALKQQDACKLQLQHIRVPHIENVFRGESETVIKMEYIYSRNFIDYFECAGFEQISYFVKALRLFLDFEISQSPLTTLDGRILHDKFDDVRNKILSNPMVIDDEDIKNILDKSDLLFKSVNELTLPIGKCHGDLTFSNILFNGNNYYLIDFLDSFIESPLMDIVKIRQDSAYLWSLQMFSGTCDLIRLQTVAKKIDRDIVEYASQFPWYENYHLLQLMNFLRILQYAKEESVMEFLKSTLHGLLDEKSDNQTTDKSEVQTNSNNTTQEQSNHHFSLIIPAAADKPHYEEEIPFIFTLNRRGISHCIEAIQGLDLSQFDNIYITILHSHDQRFNLSDILRLQFQRLKIHNAKVVILESPTLSQAETVYQTIIQENISGPIFIKDADSCFSGKITPNNGIAVYPLEQLTQVDPQHKSYVAVDDMRYITNTIEKRVIDHFFNAGGYSFEDSALFCQYYQRYKDYDGLFISHIIYSMLIDRHIFHPFMIDDYVDLRMR